HRPGDLPGGDLLSRRGMHDESPAEGNMPRKRSDDPDRTRALRPAASINQFQLCYPARTHRSVNALKKTISGTWARVGVVRGAGSSGGLDSSLRLRLTERRTGAMESPERRTSGSGRSTRFLGPL